MLKVIKQGRCQVTVAHLPAGLPVSDAPVATAFEIWKAGDGLPVRPAAVAGAARAVPAAGSAPATADARSGTPAPACPLPLPSLDGRPDAWL